MSRLEEDKKKRVSAEQRVLQEIPNLPFDDIPDGKDEDDNVEVRAVGDKPLFDFGVKDHVDIGENLRLMDFKKQHQIWLAPVLSLLKVCLPEWSARSLH